MLGTLYYILIKLLMEINELYIDIPGLEGYISVES